MTTERHEQPRSEQHSPAIAADVRDAVVSAYFPRAVAAPDSARNRAQAGYAISSAIATALVAASAYVDIEDRSLVAQVLAGVALASWIVTALLYLHAVTTAVRTPLAEDADSPDPTGWLVSVLTRSQDERDLVDRRQRMATVATVAAVIVTVPALGVALASSVALDKDRVELALSDQALATVSALCGKSLSTVQGLLESRTLRREFVVIEIERNVCDGRVRNVRIPRAAFRGRPCSESPLSTRVDHTAGPASTASTSSSRCAVARQIEVSAAP